MIRFAYITSAGYVGVCCDAEIANEYRRIYTGRQVSADEQTLILRGFVPRDFLVGCQVRRWMRADEKVRGGQLNDV